jgi:mTERF domain-containing protein
VLCRIKCLRDWGFTEREICQMSFRFPQILGYSVEAVLTPKLEFLKKVMKRPVQDVVAYPRYFSHSLAKKIKPRARVLENRRIRCDLQTMLAKSDDQFAAEFLGFESIFIPPIKP